MCFEKLKTNCYCFGGLHRSGPISNDCDWTRTSQKLLFGISVLFIRKKSTFACDKTLRAKGLGSFFTNSTTSSTEVGKKLATIILKSLWKALGIGAKIGTGLASENYTTILAPIADVMNFYHTGT